MNYVLTHTSSALNESIAGFVARFNVAKADMAERLRLRREYNQTIAELSSLSNGELADIGLSRAAIRATAYEAIYG